MKQARFSYSHVPNNNIFKDVRVVVWCSCHGGTGGLLVAGQLSGREGGRQGEEEESAGAAEKGRGRSAQAPAGSGLDEEVQTR